MGKIFCGAVKFPLCEDSRTPKSSSEIGVKKVKFCTKNAFVPEDRQIHEIMAEIIIWFYADNK